MSSTSIFERLQSLASGIRFGQFLSVGAVGFVVDNVVLTGSIEVLGMSVLLAKAISAESAIVVMFIANEYWTFDRWGETSFLALSWRFLKSNLVRSGGAATATVILLALTEVAGLHYFLANTIGIGVGFVFNYVGESLFTWRIQTMS